MFDTLNKFKKNTYWMHRDTVEENRSSFAAPNGDDRHKKKFKKRASSLH